ncbi:S8 family serine peptidase [Flavobacterium psychrotolerans]|uniref:Peptidase S8 n=1 Tax=Flavobacterium psychrotolerans TaxID=2169410 RepID=A0A2U1JQI2_9FLAO|nr:S8 family serine peptidase [Flavobacterium psychrotolerans]PWA07153.1 hypothetical protein DB895_00025 [Flavobacterium psychrotolerans]
MKKIFLLLLCPSFLFSQTVSERSSIIKSVDKNKLLDLIENRYQDNIKQSALIESFLIKNSSARKLKNSLKRIYNNIPIYYKEYNLGSSITIGANELYPGGSLGLNVTGLGMVAGVWDGAKVKNTHQELTGRVTLSDAASTFSEHSTHVTGTIIGKGIKPTSRGIAYQASVLSYDYASDTDEMISFANKGYLVSNHSYGYTPANLPNWLFGSYDDSSVASDDIAFTFPYYQIVKAAGNDREDTSLSQVNNKFGYDLLTGDANSKNVLTVAAVQNLPLYIDSGDVIISSFSDFGPTDDGRIKPDISAKGVDVYSCISSNNSSYGSLNGTSMATPAITGMILLLQKHYNNLNPNKFMLSSSIRGLICHSAREAGNNMGPDYEFGWGLANTMQAAEIISNRNGNTILDENILNKNQVFTKNIYINSVQDLSVSICWTDPAGIANSADVEDDRSPRLINNLDLKIIKDGEVFYPWKLNPDDPSAAATRDSDNEVDNIEKVQIDNAQPGTYTIQVTHKGTLKGDLQSYSLIASGTSGLTLSSNKFDFDNNIVLYPNPVSNILNFSVPRNIPISALTVFDVLGKVVNTNSQLQENAINVSHLANGIYFAKFSYEGKFILKKFIKQ